MLKWEPKIGIQDREEMIDYELKDDKKNSKIYLAGHTGLVISILRVLKKVLKNNQKRKELNLTNQAKVFKFLKKRKPAAIIMCAAKVGGISQ